MSKTGVSDQIAYRAANFVDELARRDASPSKAARFAMTRYLKMVEKGRTEVEGYFSGPEIELLLDRAWNIDWTFHDNYETFWARIEEYCEGRGIHEGLGQRVRRAPFYIIETLVDMMRIKKNESKLRTSSLSD